VGLCAARRAPRGARRGRRAQGDKRAYAEAARLPGLAVDSKQRGSQPTPLAIFKQLCFKWEKRMAGVLTSCLASKADGFVHRTVLLYLKKVVAVRATGDLTTTLQLPSAPAASPVPCRPGARRCLEAGGRPRAAGRRHANAQGCGGAASLLGSVPMGSGERP
jgi:hypothetical protein